MKVKGGTVLLDLTKSEEELFVGLYRRHRQNIRSARRRGVEIRDGGDRAACYAIYRAMCRRNLVHPESFDSVFRDKELHTAVAAGKTAAFYTTTIDDESSTVTLHRGASDPKTKSSHCNTLLLWEIIQCYKRVGFRQLDLGGVDLHSSYADGIDRYKLRWGGQLVEHESEASLSKYLWWRYLRRFRFMRQLMYWKGVLRVELTRT